MYILVLAACVTFLNSNRVLLLGVRTMGQIGWLQKLLLHLRMFLFMCTCMYTHLGMSIYALASALAELFISCSFN